MTDAFKEVLNRVNKYKLVDNQPFVRFGQIIKVIQKSSPKGKSPVTTNVVPKGPTTDATAIVISPISNPKAPPSAKKSEKKNRNW